MTEEDINKKAEKHCNEVLCNAHEKCYEVIKCRDWRSRRAGFFCGYEQALKDFEKENAELKDYRLTTLAKQQTGMSKYALNLEHKLSWYDDQLTKAKEIIREFVEWATWQGSNCPSFKSIQDKAEAFLNSEVEK